MVSKVTHIAGGVLTGVALGMNPIYTVAGALLPDIDYFLGGLHRKLLHNIWFVAALYIAGGPAIAAGAVSHLILDSVTKMGVNWCWPLPCPQIRGPVRTGGVVDTIIGAGLTIITLILIL